MVACQSKPPLSDKSPMATQQIEAKVMVHDKTKDERNAFTIDILTTKPSLYRVDASGTLGVSLFNMVIRDDEVSLIIPHRKRFYKGKKIDKAFELFFKIPMTKNFIEKLVNDEALNGATPEGISINWIKRDGDTRRVSFGDSKVEIQIAFLGVPTQVPFSDKAYRIEPPSNYKVQTID